jgi:Uma2 family endonuclease
MASGLIHRLTVGQYHAMIGAGLLTKDDPVELIEGQLVRRLRKTPAHVYAMNLLRAAFEAVLPAGWHVWSHAPVTLDDSEPEPDITVIRGDLRGFADRHPGPADVGLVAEVADRSLEFDRGSKKRVYARAGIAVYWIANLADARVELYTDPTGPAAQPDYRQHREYGPGDDVPVELDGKEIARLPWGEFMR